MAGWNHTNAEWKPKNCLICQTEFVPHSGVHKFCSLECKGKWKYVTGKESTENQYKKISGNWQRYAARLMYYAGRKRDKLSRESILDLLEKQNYLCAISGEPLTCNLEKGTICYTNASIDQIKASGGYTVDNIRIVQRIFNTMKWTQTDEEFIENCRKVVKFNDDKKKA